MQTKLYRNLYELIHPSISRKNITEYSIVLNDNVLPIKVFYPKIGVELNRVILYLQDVKQTSEFYKKMAEGNPATINRGGLPAGQSKRKSPCRRI